MKTRVILASSSPRRQQLLKKAVDIFDVMPSDFDESKLDHGDPVKFAIEASYEKAKDIASKHPEAIVIGADTIVVLGGRILGKPKDLVQAGKMLKDLSGKTHQVITGVTIFKGGRHRSGNEITDVTFNELTDKDIKDYLASHEVLDKAGSYAIQEIGARFVKKVKGDRENVVGLPVKMVASMIRLSQ